MRERTVDIAVVSGLVVFALWTYIFLPLVYFHT